ncbi:hypothetical protein H7097_03520 [Aeromicrobium sp.]|nr:hypothetical protein [Candidatus Saccharibacteria bacterium]
MLKDTKKKTMTKKMLKSKPVSKISKAKPAVKPRATKIVSKAKVTTKSHPTTASKTVVAKKARKSVTSKKSVQPKGFKHHAKRIYHLTPKFIHGMVAGAFVGVVLVTSLGITGGAVNANPAPAGCIKVTDGINVNNANANATVKLNDGCGVRKFVLKAYYAPNDKGGAFGSQQVQFAVTTPPAVVKTAGHEPVKIHVNMFDNSCFYQVDLVDVTNGDNDGKNPIAAVATGGKKDCRPDQSHAYACGSLGLTPGDHTATISTFTTTQTNATFTGATIDWGDNTIVQATAVQGQTHKYSADNTYTVSVIAKFTYTGRFDGVHNVTAPACSQSITFATPPPNTKLIYICQISSKQIVNIDEKLFGTPQYPVDQYTKDLTQCVVVPPPTAPPTTTPPTNAPPATLANTGPGAVLVVFGLAMIGGYVFHMTHRHVQHKKRSHRA